MRVFDCFPFFNELDLLEIRLNELAPVVDRFVVAESATTFSGRPKPLHFAGNRERFANFADRIRHVVVDVTGAADISAWERRRQQCDALVKGLDDAAADDIVLMSDVDEIVRPDVIFDLRSQPPRRREVVCFELRMANFFVNLESGERWIRSGPRAARWADVSTMEGLRKVPGPASGLVKNATRGLRAWSAMGSPVRRRLVRDAGWHFSYLGDAETIRTKKVSFVGSDGPKKNVESVEQIRRRIDEARSYSFPSAGLKYRDLDESFPAYLRENRERFAHIVAERSRYANLAET